ncbi:MAG: aminoacyl-histidine dipeptidase [Lachnospiraceae bacterium]|nr:aminoacyl-histidine dipeptidase [Lachnospiraceae bacterium]
MRVWENLEPKAVFHYFEDICNIPHGSGNVERISNYLVDFAKERNLEYYQDETLNVIIIKEATPGYEDHEPVMLQGHMDMVAVKKPECDINMKEEGLRIQTDGDRVYAEGTSLGGDDGIAIAYGLALLDSKEYKHPRIELVVTVDEETGMDGARAIDFAPCRAHTLINLDSEEEGIFLAGCAGGARVNYEFNYDQNRVKGMPCKIRVSGLLGGHSGAEIHKERGNAVCLLARVLTELACGVTFCIEFLEGGLADNAIPREAAAGILVTGYKAKDGNCRIDDQDFKESECGLLIENTIARLNKELQNELAEKDPGVLAEITLESIGERDCMSEERSLVITSFLNTLPYGVQAMSGAMEGMVETSLNPGILKCSQGHFHLGISVRSSLDSAKYALINKLKSIAHLGGISAEVTGEYPGWAYRKDSPLRDKMVQIYEEMYHQKPEIQAIHAGLECGLFAQKIEDLDCVSLGPDMKNIHTTEEELSISSTERVWKYLIRLLEEM